MDEAASCNNLACSITARSNSSDPLGSGGEIMGTLVSVDVSDHVGIITLRRPERLNAMSIELMGELYDAIEAIDKGEPTRERSISARQSTRTTRAGWSSSPVRTGRSARGWI